MSGSSFSTFSSGKYPITPAIDQLEVHEPGADFDLVIVCYGFMDVIDLPRTIAQCQCGTGLLDMMDTTFFYSRENMIPTHGAGMMIWREHIFAAMARSAANPMTFFRIPANRVVELGAQVEICIFQQLIARYRHLYNSPFINHHKNIIIFFTVPCREGIVESPYLQLD